jgi:hypothetical protein
MSNIHVEREDDGSYTATQNHRTIATGDTQREAIDNARDAKPDDPVLAERQRFTEEGKPDKWRRVY